MNTVNNSLRNYMDTSGPDKLHFQLSFGIYKCKFVLICVVCIICIVLYNVFV